MLGFAPKLGAPILFGIEQRVTFLACEETGKACSESFQAFHVPHMIMNIEKHTLETTRSLGHDIRCGRKERWKKIAVVV